MTPAETYALTLYVGGLLGMPAALYTNSGGMAMAAVIALLPWMALGEVYRRWT